MKLMDNLKKQAKSNEKAKEPIKNADMMLTDDELEMVAGGIGDNNMIGDQESVFQIFTKVNGPHWLLYYPNAAHVLEPMIPSGFTPSSSFA